MRSKEEVLSMRRMHQEGIKHLHEARKVSARRLADKFDCALGTILRVTQDRTIESTRVLDADDVRLIRELYDEGRRHHKEWEKRSIPQIAKQHDAGVTAVRDVVRYRSYRHVFDQEQSNE